MLAAEPAKVGKPKRPMMKYRCGAPSGHEGGGNPEFQSSYANPSCPSCGGTMFVEQIGWAGDDKPH